MHKFTLSAVISALLLGNSAAALAQEPSQAAEPQTPATQAPNTSTDASGASGSQAPVGTTPSNVDEHSSSGSYYPYSSGTVGDDPAKPEATTVPVQAGKEGDRSSATTTGDWMTVDTNGDEQLSKAEIDKAWPTVGAHFDEIDVDGDKQATRDELRSWHESQKTRMEADQPASAPASMAPAAGTVPDAQSPANVPPVTPSNDEPTTSDAGTTNQ
jgi:hypothetical protein